ncbi:MAG: 50S ribosomal protein P1 [Thermofilum sp. ex4484_82]|nr:50S ribosomal protein P1 [Thermoproteales archaeon]OYT26540.1 MAG: 50S ribosomal protein P1 [Thermofilum sp. ex4484_82]OYT37190.1 MAG: 50S ribosomal protein P1 [Archaeoglobales archaeon ex4484_92]RLE75353.1 MAG: 50S ribosomal protein P1 [Thermoprotei archaeon]RLE85024.1 MAG: 50S ribosomal protein P1 [Thermoprotei archaeon]
MEYVYASLLLHYAKKPVNEENVKKVLEAAGISVDDARVKALVAALNEIDIDEAIKSAAVPAMVAPVAPSEAPPEEEKKEAKEEKEKKEEEAEEEIAEGLSALFG